MKRKVPNSLRRRWAKFLSGTWTKTAPTNPGTYPVAPERIAGEPTPKILMNVAQTDDGLYYSLPGKSETNSCPWEGWVWSQPLPNLPEPPK